MAGQRAVQDIEIARRQHHKTGGKGVPGNNERRCPQYHYKAKPGYNVGGQRCSGQDPHHWLSNTMGYGAAELI